MREEGGDEGGGKREEGGKGMYSSILVFTGNADCGRRFEEWDGV